ALAAAENMLGQLPGHDEVPSRLAAAEVRFALARRTGALPAARAAAADAVALVRRLPPESLERHPGLHGQLGAAQALVEFWSGDFAQAAAAFRAASPAMQSAYERAGCLGRLAQIEAVSGRLTSAMTLAADAAELFRQDLTAEHPHRAATVARAYVHLQRHELAEARRQLRGAEAALRASPDRLTAALASLVAARGCLAEGRFREAAEIVARARDGWSAPPWLERHLALVESHAFAAVRDTGAALAAARRAGPESSLEAAAAMARAWLAAGDGQAAEQALTAAAHACEGSPDPARIEATLAEAHLAASSGERGHAARLVEQALRLAEAEQLRLPFIVERGWLEPLLDSDPGLARAYRDVMGPRQLEGGPGRARAAIAGTPSAVQSHAVAGAADDAPLVVESLTEREREVLRHVSELLLTAEIASEMYVSVNTVKSHLKSIFRKLGAASRNEAVRRARQLELI
ncbi:MAG: hypothetical protein JO132_20055, partial [Streptosporangiaceae bacterium]|nr:hypothetical protein [Streptosporangiaceae bacterium]